MTMHSGTLPDCVSVHVTHPVMYTLKWGEGVQRYLSSAHIKTLPGVVASSKLVPFEIQQTSWSHDVPVCAIRLPVRPRRLRIKSWYLPCSWIICNVFKAPSVDTDQTPCKSEPWHFHAVSLARLQQAAQGVDTITRAPYISVQHNTMATQLMPYLWSEWRNVLTLWS